MDGTRLEHNPVLRHLKSSPRLPPLVGPLDHSPKRRAAICDWYRSRRPCPYGVRCAFAHGESQLYPRPWPPEETASVEESVLPETHPSHLVQEAWERRLERGVTMTLDQELLENKKLEEERVARLEEARRERQLGEERAERRRRLAVEVAMEAYALLEADPEAKPRDLYLAKQRMDAVLDEHAELWALMQRERKHDKAVRKAVVVLQAMQRGRRAREAVGCFHTSRLSGHRSSGPDLQLLERLYDRRSEVSDPPPTVPELKQMLVCCNNHVGITLLALKRKKQREAFIAGTGEAPPDCQPLTAEEVERRAGRSPSKVALVVAQVLAKIAEAELPELDSEQEEEASGAEENAPAESAQAGLKTVIFSGPLDIGGDPLEELGEELGEEGPMLDSTTDLQPPPADHVADAAEAPDSVAETPAGVVETTSEGGKGTSKEPGQ